MKKLFIQSCILICTITLFTRCNNVDEDIPTTTLRDVKTIEVEGLKRHYILKLPQNFESLDSVPLVIFLHGFAGSMEQAESDYGFNEKADTEGFVVVYPDGIQNDGIFGLRSWNAGQCCEYAEKNNIDDVGFIEKIIDNLLLEYPQIDSNKIYTTGISNGAMMCYRLAIELYSKISAIAPVSGPLMLESDLTSPMPILHIHSLKDDKVPYNGGLGIGGYNFNSVTWTLEQWQIQNGCTSNTTVDYGNFSIIKYSDCTEDNEILLYLTEDGGHSWPGSKIVRSWADLPSTAFNATSLIWDFFKRH